MSDQTLPHAAEAALPPATCSALAGAFDIEAIEQAFFNHDHDGSEPAPGQWEKRRAAWRSFKAYLAAHPKQEISGRDAYKEEQPNKHIANPSDDKPREYPASSSAEGNSR